MTADAGVRGLAAELRLAAGKIEYLAKKGIIAADTLAGGRPGFSSASKELARSAIAQLKWMVIVTPENWRELSANDLAFTMFSGRHEEWLEFVRPGQQMLFYVTRFSSVVAHAEVAGTKQKKRVLWKGGAFTYLVPLRPLVVVDPVHGLPIAPLIRNLQFIVKKANWGMYLRRSLIPLVDRDYRLLVHGLEAHVDSPQAHSVMTGRPSK